MLDFFISLLGGAYYAGKSWRETSKNIASTRAALDYEQRKLDILSTRVLRRYEEEAIRNYVRNGHPWQKDGNYKEIREKFQEDFEYVYGSDWEDQHTRPTYSEEWIYRLILASKGKVDRQMIYFGYPIASQDDDARIIDLKFARCIERHLKQAGIDDPLIVDNSSAVKFKSLRSSTYGGLELKDEYHYALQDAREKKRRMEGFKVL